MQTINKDMFTFIKTIWTVRVPLQKLTPYNCWRVLRFEFGNFYIFQIIHLFLDVVPWTILGSITLSWCLSLTCYILYYNFLERLDL